MSHAALPAAAVPTLTSQELQARFDQRLSDLFDFWRQRHPARVFGEHLDSDAAVTELAGFCAERDDPATSWVALCAIAGAFPNEDECRDFHGTVAVPGGTTVHDTLLAATRTALRTSRPAATMRFVVNQVCADVDFSCQTDFTTGIQRVTRSVVGAWNTSNKPHQLVKWSADHAFMTPLAPAESLRMGAPAQPHDHADVMAVPIDSTVFVPEVGDSAACEALGAMARHSGNRLVGIGYDVIPVTSARFVTSAETQKFVTYLSAVKYFTAVAAISESAATEFRGFNKMLASQGLAGPDVVVETLPIQAIAGRSNHEPASVPLVLCVGTLEGRKNQRRVLAAAEAVWRTGRSFRLVFVGHASFESAGGMLSEMAELKKRGRLVSVVHGIGDNELAELYDTAACTVFISSHEGFGLPVAESVAHGTPVIATNYGSIAQLARQGNHILVSPSDARAVSAAIEDALEAKNIAAPEPSVNVSADWDEYAKRLWGVLNVA